MVVDGPMVKDGEQLCGYITIMLLSTFVDHTCQ